jgi:hypothetical protein
MDVSGPSKNDLLPTKLVEPLKMPDQAVVRKRTVTFKGEVSGNTPKADPRNGRWRV